MPMTKAQAEEIIKRGESVIVGGVIVSSVDDLPKNMDDAPVLASSDPQKLNEGEYSPEKQEEEQSSFGSLGLSGASESTEGPKRGRPKSGEGN